MNALVRLDTFANVILTSLDLDSLEQIEAMFQSHLPHEPE